MFGGLNKIFSKDIESGAGSHNFPKKEKSKRPIDYTENYALLECETPEGEPFKVKSYVHPKTLEDIDEVPQKYLKYFRNDEFTEVRRTIHPFDQEENEQE